MATLTNLLDFDPAQLAAYCAELGEKPFRAKQLQRWIHQFGVANFDDMTDLAKSLREKLKTRAEVRHSTKKPWRQKGTGRARAGMTSSPLWRGGGRIFPNKVDENFTQKLNRKMYRAGMAAILSQLVREERLSVIDGFAVAEPKTKVLAGKLRDLGVNPVLILTHELDENLYLSSRNLPNVMVLEARHADPVSLMRFEKVLMTRDAVKHLEEALA